MTEVVIPPRSPLIGTKVYPGMATPDGELVILAARRGDQQLKGQEIIVQAGDALLLQGSWDELTRHTESAPACSWSTRRAGCAGRCRSGAARSARSSSSPRWCVLLATGIVPPAIAGLLAAGALVVTRTVSPAQAYRSISWTTVVLIAGMIPLSTAFIETGTADLVAGWLLSVIGDSSAYVALAVLCVLTLVLGQLISNTATVLIVAPDRGLARHGAWALSVQPFMMALTVIAAAAFLTPIATPANLMVMEPAATASATTGSSGCRWR